jgi:hypothetical protein
MIGNASASADIIPTVKAPAASNTRPVAIIIVNAIAILIDAQFGIAISDHLTIPIIISRTAG